MRQLYEIGELVIRQATTYTEHNGEYKIAGIICAKEMKQLHPFMKVIDGWYYELEGFNVDLPSGGISNHTHESFLRKIHKPSTQSFTELMSVLKSPIASPNKVQ